MNNEEFANVKKIELDKIVLEKINKLSLIK